MLLNESTTYNENWRPPLVTKNELMAAFYCHECGTTRPYGHGKAANHTARLNCELCRRVTLHSYHGQRLFSIDSRWDPAATTLEAVRFYLVPTAAEEA